MKKMAKAIPFKKKTIVNAISAVLLTSSFSLLAADETQTTNEQGAKNKDIEVIQVTGIRKSMAESLYLKKDADSIVDAISAEDVGKFPDKNVADSLQRIPGISVDRTFGEGRDVFVRGTGNGLNRTFMNGQNVASAYWWANDNASRGFNYTMLPSELVSRLEVYKSPQAKLDEGSIGGSVIVFTRRPMDVDPLVIQGSVESVYSDLPGVIDPQISSLVSWTNEEHSFGILASYSFQERELRRDGLEAFPTNALYSVTDENDNVTEDVYAVWGGGSTIFKQERERSTANITFQWQPTTEWDIVFNTVRSDLKMDNSNQNYLFLAGGAAVDGNINVTNPGFFTTSDGKQALSSGILSDNGNINAALDAIWRESTIETSVYDLDATYIADSWTAHGQIGFTRATGGSEHDQNYWFDGASSTQINLSNNINEFSFPDIDTTDASALTLNPDFLVRDWIREMEDQEFYAQGDINIDLDYDFIDSIEFGAKYRDHVIENNRTDAAASTSSDHPRYSELQAISLADVSSGLSPDLNGVTATAGSLTSYAWVDKDLVQSLVNPILNDLYQYNVNESAYFNINEKISAIYGQANFVADNLRGNIGLRVVKTDQTSEAYIDGAIDSVNRSYTDVLPSLNVVYDFSESVIIRGAIAKTMARPSYTDISSNLLIDATTQTASAGNPFLEPTYANQFEIGAEWYFGETSLVSATYFNKDLSTSIIKKAGIETINGEQVSVTRPYNADGAKIQGLELQWQQDIGMGFGMLTNLTLTDAEVSAEVGDLELPGNSKVQLNASVFYEVDTFSARLSYNYRSEAYGNLIMGGQIVTDDYGQFDATMGWDVTDHINLFMTSVNITNEVIYTNTTDGMPVGFYENGARYSVGARFKF